jgi:hypothetical protein
LKDKNNNIYKHLIYGNLLSHFFKTCRELDTEFFHKEFLAKAAGKAVSPLHVSNVGIDRAIDDIFLLDVFVTAIRPILKKQMTDPSQTTLPDNADFFRAM